MLKMNKLDELKVRSYDKNYDIIIITEVYPKLVTREKHKMYFVDFKLMGIICIAAELRKQQRSHNLRQRDRSMEQLNRRNCYS